MLWLRNWQSEGLESHAGPSCVSKVDGPPRGKVALSPQDSKWAARGRAGPGATVIINCYLSKYRSK